jgi:predicted house-cleaning noncanonical NTP pyrophosphatase (MazG superfamily)
LPQKYNKAVRDRIPEIIITSGKMCEIITLPDDKFLIEMEKKLSEEVNEYLESKSINELADILEVVYRIGELTGTNHAMLERIRKDKAKTRGKFSKNYFLVGTP